jgi:hypothetical protein
MLLIPKDGSIMLTGQFSGKIVLDPGGPHEALLEAVPVSASCPNEDIFIALFNATGHLVWARREGGTDYEYPTGMLRFADGSLAMGGELGDPGNLCGPADTVIGVGDPQQQTLTNAGAMDLFFARFVAK